MLSPGDVNVCEAAVELAGRLKESLLPHGAPPYLPVLASVQKVGQAQGRHTLCNQGGDPRCIFKIKKSFLIQKRIPYNFRQSNDDLFKSNFLRSKQREKEISCTALQYNLKCHLEEEVYKSMEFLLQIHFNANFFCSKQR